MSILATISIKRAKKSKNHFIFQFSDNQMISFNTQNAQWKAFSDPLDRWQSIESTDFRFNAYIQIIISYINQRNALANSTLYQTLLRRR